MLSAAGPASSTQAAGSPTRARPDFNGDGFADLAVGVPEEDVDGAVDAGAVQVIYGSADGLNGDSPIDDQFWTENGFGLSTIVSEFNDHFGSAVATGDFEGDGFDDLAIGVPKQDVAVSGKNVVNAGAVYVLRGSSSGLTTHGGLFTQHRSRSIPGHAEAGDHFGSSLTVGNFGRGPWDDLAVGVPGEDIPNPVGAKDQGAVNIVYGSRSGLGARHRGQSLHGNSSDGRFGFSLAAANLRGTHEDELVVGAPYATSASPEEEKQKPEFGMVVVADSTPLGFPHHGIHWVLSQGGRMPGVDERYDHFGWALATGNFGRGRHADLAVGVPGDARGRGSVVIFYDWAFDHFGQGPVVFRGVRRWTQGSSGIPGDPKEGDQFGFALAAADFGIGAGIDLAVGAPGDKGGVGGVNVLFGSTKGLSARGTQFIWQNGSSFEGATEGDSEVGDEFGWTLVGANFGKGPVADLAIGVPGETVEGFFSNELDVGAVNVLYGDGRGLRESDDQFWWQASASLHDSAEEFDRFGTALAR
jgi:hypothetical protein